MITKLLSLTIVLIVTLDGIHCRSRYKRSESAVESSMKENGVVSDVIDFAPKEKIMYPSHVNVNLGNELTPLSTKDEPIVKWLTEKDGFYTLIMVDSDVSSRTNRTLGPLKHWLVVNIPGTDLSKGELLAVPIGPAPTVGTGAHRYIFQAYKQPGFLKHSETPVDPNKNEERMKINVKEFAKKYNLGQPYAGNFFQANIDDYTRQLWTKWNGNK